MRNSQLTRRISVFGTLLVLLTGCVGAGEPEVISEPSQVVTPPAIDTEEAAPTFEPGGSAEDNFAVFEWTLRESGAGLPQYDVEKIVSALEDLGFDRGSMSHTAPASKIELPADSTSLAIDIAGECLIGQFSDEWVTVAIAPPTPSGCLIGDVILLESPDAAG